jgi:hypothetical protein
MKNLLALLLLLLPASMVAENVSVNWISMFRSLSL